MLLDLWQLATSLLPSTYNKGLSFLHQQQDKTYNKGLSFLHRQQDKEYKTASKPVPDLAPPDSVSSDLVSVSSNPVSSPAADADSGHSAEASILDSTYLLSASEPLLVSRGSI